MANLYLSVKGQTLTVKSDIDRIVENSIKYLKINIDTSQDSEWLDPSLNIKCILSNKEKKTSAFSNGNYVTKNFLKAPGFVVHLVGYKTKTGTDGTTTYEKLIPTNPVIVTIHPTGVLNAENEPIEEIKTNWADSVIQSFNTKISEKISKEMNEIKKEQNLFINNTNIEILKIQEKVDDSYEYALFADNKADKLIEAVGLQTTNTVLVGNSDKEKDIFETENKRYSTSNGNSTDDNNALSTVKIPVKEGEVYTVTGSYNGSNALITEFKEDGSWNRSYGSSSLGGYSKIDYSYTVPEKVFFVVFSTLDRVNNPLKVEGPFTSLRTVDDAIEDKIDPLINDVNVLKEDVPILRDDVDNLDIELKTTSEALNLLSENMIDAIGLQTTNTVLVGNSDKEKDIFETENKRYSTSNGNSTDNNNALSTVKIPVKEGEVYTIEGHCAPAWALISEFDEEENWIASYGYNQLGAYTFSSVEPYKPYTYTVPEKVKYVVFSTDDASNVPLKVTGPFTSFKNVDENIKEKIKPIEENILTIEKDVDTIEAEIENISDAIGKNIYLQDMESKLTFVDKATITATTGNLREPDKDTENARRTAKFGVSAGEIYHIWGKCTTQICLVAWYDEKGIFISSVYASGEQKEVADNQIFEVPETLIDKLGVERKVSYMACCSSNNNSNPLIIKKEISEYDKVKNTAEKVVEDALVTKLDKVLISPNGSEWVLTISNDGTLKAVKLRAYGEDVETTLSLPDNLEAGTYTLKYENAEGVLSNCAAICSLDVTTESEKVSYNGFIAENCAPKTATCIGIYDSFNVRIGGLDLGFLSNHYSDKLYTFSAIADIHIGVSDGIEDFTNAAKYFEDEDEIEFITVCGDMVNDSSQITELQAYQNIAGKITKPVYVVTGNHEANNYNDGEDFHSIKHFFTQENYPNINQDLFYSFTYRNDVFIMVGTYGEPGYNKTFSLEELQWLHRTLEDNRNKRCFLYTHYYPIDGSGDPLGLYKGNGFNNQFGRIFLSLLKHYKNVIYFHGHTHTAFEVQEYHHMNNIDRNYGRYSIHIPSLTWPRIPSEDMTEYDKKSSEGQGYIVDVYENGIALKGRDFEKGKFVPIGTYYLDTVPVVVEANSYRDPTGILTTPVEKIE